MVRSLARRCAWFSLLLIAVTGCGKGPLVPVRGTVKLDGRPLPQATVRFIAREAGGRDALGFTDADGVFRLTTFQPGDGAFPGKYKVIVQPPAEAEGGPAAATPEAAQQAAPRSRPKGPSLPPRYSQPDQTILVQDVPPSGEVILELSSK
jgi:hypothetical protein